MFNIFKLNDEDTRIKYYLMVLGLILLLAIPHFSSNWHAVFAVLFVGLGAYYKHWVGGLLTAVWMIFSLEVWTSLATVNALALVTQGLVFGRLFEYQASLKDDLKEKSNSLRKEKEMLNKILKTTIDGFFMLDKEGNFIKANQAYQNMIGYAEEELLNFNINDISLIMDKEEHDKHIKKIIAINGGNKFESLHQAKDGETINLETSVNYVDDIKEGVFIVFARDISARKEKERKLKASEAKFKSYIEHAPYAIAVFNSAGEYIEVNPMACQLGGFSEEEILGEKFGTVGSVLDSKKAQEYFVKLKEEGAVRGEFVFRKSLETKLDVEINAVKINSDRYIGFADDISHRKEIEREIRAERDKLKKYFEITQAIVIRLDENKKIREINQNGCEILECTREEALGSNWFKKFVKKDDRPKSERVFRKGFEEKEIINGENTVVTTTGEEKNILWHNNILTNEAGEVVESLSLGVDITEIKSLREELEHSKLQMQFFANLSHELKTPLNLIFSAHQMLEMEQEKLPTETENKLKKYSNIISQNSNRLLRLVNNLLDINKFQANAFNLNLGNHNLVQIVRNIAFSITDHIEGKGREFEFESKIDEKVIACDPFNLERVLLNLLSNAIKFTEKGDKIKIEIIDLENTMRIKVRDSGIGIPKNKQELIFQRFGQVDKSLTRNTEGSGIGLSIVKLIIQAHGGEIKVESEYGVGSEFIIDLPVTKLEQETEDNSYLEYNSQQLIDRINMEFSDIYN
ncbi:PAS domain-containing sensor histidine kinase [Halanaerobacter jeridensis]|uniref:histidine kinase n=1 Tax=Halanaerobacter jeridensis TaxID=706427 RepID=A0A939BQS7_9FIRM|nr:PAS domain-containing sensor histidine kinase [Halanaerobacter jeridensis]MBM7555216.1 PAS domain S-box-containing protein [Halanaerobacter jeridensis]